MIKEHLVSASVTNNGECICNPEVLLGTKYGLWDFENEQAPRGALIDLNAAWELFLSRKGFSNVSYTSHEHRQHEVIDGVVYEQGDITYILNDDKGNPTGASFTVKANKGPVEHIEWEKGNLILYYTKERPLEDKDIQSGIPIHYVKDEEGNVIIDQETGKPLIFDYVVIPVIEIFDNDETRQLFPWFSDENNVTQLRDSIDGSTGHLGSFAITPESEVYFAKEVNADKNQDLVSLQSVHQQLSADLGIIPSYEKATDYPDPDDGEYHTYRVNGSNLSEVLHEGLGAKDSLVNAINEDLVRTRINTRLIADKIVESNLNWQNLLEFADSIKNQAFKNSTVPNLLTALNWIQTAEIGPFKENLDQNITKEVEGEQKVVENITEALNVIFQEAESNRDRIGYDRISKHWIELTTDNKDSLAEAINEVDEHENALADIIQVKEEWDPVRKITFYSNPDLNNITKNRLRQGYLQKNDITIVEAINELQSEIGNLSNSASGDTSIPQLNTDNKTSLVEAINEVDTHADNNKEVIGAEYTIDVEGKKNSEITNLETTNKSSIVAAINELDARVGELDNLDTDDKDNIVDAINEVIKEQPIVYEDTENPNSGIVLKNHSNHAGNKSLVIGEENESTQNSFISGKSNSSQGDFTNINGESNISKKKYNFVSGKSNNNDGNYNLVNGQSNTVKGDNNLVSGSNNNVSTENSRILGNNIIGNNTDNITAMGDTIILKDNIDDTVALGRNIKVNGDDAIALGNSNIVSEESVVIGHNNETEGPGNVAIGDNNYIGCEDSYTIGNGNRTEGDHTYVTGENNSVTGDNNYVIGKNQIVEGDNNVVIGNNGTVRTNNSITIGEFNNPKDNSVNIGRPINIQTHNSESTLQELIFVNLNDWCKNNNAASLNGGKFLDSQHLVNAIKAYKTKNYSDNALLRFTMLTDNENGYAIIQGKTVRVYVNGSWYFSDNIQNGWSRHEGEYLKVISKVITDSQGNQITKHYLALMDQMSTETIVDGVGGQRSNTEDFGTIDLSHAYGAVDIDDLETALDLKNKLNTKVDKTAEIITKYHDSTGAIINKSQNFVNPNSSSASGSIVLDLKESFGFDSDNFQLKNERGEPNGYVPLNSGGLIDSQYLPSFVDDVIEVWAEYQIESPSGAVIDIHLYKLVKQIVPSTGQEVYSKGEEILEGEPGKIYIEANPSSQRRFAAQFRWSGHQFVAIGFTNITIGEVEGTAYDGGKGKALRDEFDDHKNSGTTQIPVETPEGTKWVTYKPNPHNVKAVQLDVIVNDPNDPRNINLENEYIVEYNVDSAIKALFDRLNKSEDQSGSVINVIGTQEDLDALDALDDIEGNNAPTLIQLALANKEAIDNIDIIDDNAVDDLVDTYFNLNG